MDTLLICAPVYLYLFFVLSIEGQVLSVGCNNVIEMLYNLRNSRVN